MHYGDLANPVGPCFALRKISPTSASESVANGYWVRRYPLTGNSSYMKPSCVCNTMAQG